MPLAHGALIDAIVRLLRDRYVDGPVAAELDERLRGALPEYRSIEHADELALRLTADLRAWSGDRHFRVDHRPTEAARLRAAPVEDRVSDAWLARLAAESYGFERVEWLARRVGYIDLRSFAPVELGGDTATAALVKLAGAAVLIFDLRGNDGGEPSMVQRLISHLFIGPPRHFNSFYVRERDEHTEFWTLPDVPGPRFADALVFVLTSQKTFSAAEEFAYALKAMERGVVVGETTAGAANFGERVGVDERFTMFLPIGRPINPITGGSWEGTGVTPHVAVAAVDALDVARRLALDALLERSDDDAERGRLRAEIAALRPITR